MCVCVCVWTKHYLSFFQGHLGLVQLTHFYVWRLARQTTRLIEGFRHHLVFIFFKTLFYLTHCVHIHSVVIRFDHLYPCAIIFLSLNQKKKCVELNPLEWFHLDSNFHPDVSPLRVNPIAIRSFHSINFSFISIVDANGRLCRVNGWLIEWRYIEVHTPLCFDLSPYNW